MLKTKIGAAVFFGAALVASGAAAQEAPDMQDPVEPDEPTIPADPQDPAAPVVPAEPVPPVPVAEPVIITPPPPEPTPVNVDVHMHDLAMDKEKQPIGISLTVGGGVIGFTDESMRDTTSAGGMWDVRAAIGTRSPIAVEAAYIGTAQGIDTVGLDDSAVLIGTGVEAVARVNLLPLATVNPYFFGGAAWKRYDLANTDTNTSDVNDVDNLIEIPVGVGLSYRVNGFLLDVRGALRMATEEDLIRQDPDTEDVRLHAWTAGAKLGYEF